jgi:hypothetical protein
VYPNAFASSFLAVVALGKVPGLLRSLPKPLGFWEEYINEKQLSSISGSLISGFSNFVSGTPGAHLRPRGSRISQGSSGLIGRHFSDDVGVDGVDSSTHSLTSNSSGGREKVASPLAKAVRNVGAMWTGGEGGSGKMSKRRGPKIRRR